MERAERPEPGSGPFLTAEELRFAAEQRERISREIAEERDRRNNRLIYGQDTKRSSGGWHSSRNTMVTSSLA